MAHEIYIQSGKASMFYVGDPPWHGLGTQLNNPATAAQAIKAAKLDWEVLKMPLYANDGHKNCRIPDKYAIVPADRWGTDDCPIFGTVGPYYTILQNRDAFSFFDPIVGKEAAIYHTAGALGKGERIWILAKLPAEIRIAGDDIASKFLLLSNSHDGQGSVQIKFTPIRVVCQNTLTQALRDGQTIRVPHLSNIEERLQFAAKAMGFINNYFSDLEQSFQAMAKIQLNANGLSSYLNRIFPDPQNPNNRSGIRKAADNRLWSQYFFENGKGNKEPAVQGTLWAAYNGVAEMIDHCVTKKIPNEQRLDSVWFGPGYLAKARAYDGAVRVIQGQSS
jgi:phage/plasmid-like protein (TIGR03299 family)